MESFKIYLYCLQILIPVLGCYITWKIFKLINHGNGWWIMSMGFFMFIIQTVVTMFAPKDSVFWQEMRLTYSPILLRSLFLFSAWRVLKAVIKEHEAKLTAERAAEESLEKIKELTGKIDNVVLNCPRWDNNLKICEADK